jgi:hypothetical protein
MCRQRSLAQVLLIERIVLYRDARAPAFFKKVPMQASQTEYDLAMSTAFSSLVADLPCDPICNL